MSTPLNLKYTKDHEWVLVENDIATIDSTNKTLELRIIGWNISSLINYDQQ